MHYSCNFFSSSFMLFVLQMYRIRLYAEMSCAVVHVLTFVKEENAEDGGRKSAKPTKKQTERVRERDSINVKFASAISL